MSDKKIGHKRKHSDGKSFLILPIIFFIGIYLVIYLAFAPVGKTIINTTGLFFSDMEMKTSTDYNNIFVPFSENKSLQIIEKDDKTYIDITSFEFPTYGTQFGMITIDDCDVNCKLFFGDGDVALRNGVGIYSGSFIPGYGGTILVAGHNNTYLNGLKNAEAGQIVKIQTNYGDYEYRINETAVKQNTDTSAYDLDADYENLIMYTCYPFDELGLTDYRYFVYAEYVSGSQIDKTVKETE